MRKIYFAIIAAMMMGAALAIHQWGSTKEKSNLLWENIEALANIEGYTPETKCFLTGDVKCPLNGDMVRSIMDINRIKEKHELK